MAEAGRLLACMHEDSSSQVLFEIDEFISRQVLDTILVVSGMIFSGSPERIHFRFDSAQASPLVAARRPFEKRPYECPSQRASVCLDPPIGQGNILDMRQKLQG